LTHHNNRPKRNHIRKILEVRGPSTSRGRPKKRCTRKGNDKQSEYQPSTTSSVVSQRETGIDGVLRATDFIRLAPSNSRQKRRAEQEVSYGQQLEAGRNVPMRMETRQTRSRMSSRTRMDADEHESASKRSRRPITRSLTRAEQRIGQPIERPVNTDGLRQSSAKRKKAPSGAGKARKRSRHSPNSGGASTCPASIQRDMSHHVSSSILQREEHLSNNTETLQRMRGKNFRLENYGEGDAGPRHCDQPGVLPACPPPRGAPGNGSG